MAGINFKDEEEVKEYLKNLHIEYQFGCYSEKKPEVCHLLGDYNEAIKVNHSEAGKIYKKNCDDYNFGRSCTKYGEYVYVGRGCKRNTMEAYKYMKKGCEANDAKGCLDTGIFAISEENLENSKESQISLGMDVLKKACDANLDSACFYLSGIYMRGIEGFVEKSMKDAYTYSLKSCEAGNPYACSNLSKMHRIGDGVKKSEEMAKLFKSKANRLLEELRKNKPQLQFQQGIDP
ncbi:cytochrome c oxidase assembly factor 7 [Megachile rotundata]|uniref:cytochrome c oxidase assembly factor 7 n=1 Tax=Megachile rotundata TaxID=143995 RepID=UPI000258F1B5|nr:PREDICTED: cytochrome c oxidase assembly factor 7 homolog [Megachile rotundata]